MQAADISSLLASAGLFHIGLQQTQLQHVHFLSSILATQRSYAEQLADPTTKVCPVAKNDRSHEQNKCRAGLKVWRYHSHMIRHFLTDHAELAKTELPNACLICKTDCETPAARVEHEKSPVHLAALAELEQKSKKRSAAEAVSGV
jgi:hypothetical protein